MENSTMPVNKSLFPVMDKCSSKSERARTYPNSAIAPFIVFLEQRTEHHNLLSVSEILHIRYRSVVEIRRLTPEKIKVVLSNRIEANDLIESEHCRPKFRVYAPYNRVEINGVVYEAGIDLNLLKKHGIGKFKDPRMKPVTIVACNQLAYYSAEDKCYKPSSGIRVSFSGTVLPDFIEVQKVMLPVRPFVPKIMVCNKCKKYGHTRKYCRSEVRCGICMGKHCESECTTETDICFRCKEKHENISSCPEFKAKQRQAKRKLIAFCERSYTDNLNRQIELENNSNQSSKPNETNFSNKTQLVHKKAPSIPTGNKQMSSAAAKQPNSSHQTSTNKPRSVPYVARSTQDNTASLFTLEQILSLICDSFNVRHEWKIALQSLMPLMTHIWKEVLQHVPQLGRLVTV